jgi:hypothetical protein
MNCCDEYGNCRQGSDCPARKDSALAIDFVGDEPEQDDSQPGIPLRLLLVMLIASFSFGLIVGIGA